MTSLAATHGASPGGFLVFCVTVGLIVVSLQIYRWFGPGGHACFYCGTRNGDHGPTCPERR